MKKYGVNRKDEFWDRPEYLNPNARNDDTYDHKAKKKARQEADKEIREESEQVAERYEEYQDLHR